MATTMLVLAATLSTGCGGRPRAAAAKILARVKGRLSVSVVDKTQKGGAGNGSWNIRGDEPFAAGESIGVFVVAELFRQAEAGEADLDERIPFAEEARPLSLRHLGSVGEVSLRDLAVLVLADGDAAATNMLIDHLTFEKINRNARALGARRTSVKRKLGISSPPENYTSANDLAAAWALLARGGAFSRAARASIGSVLRASRENRPQLLVLAGIPAADVRCYYDGDSPVRGSVVHGAGVLYLPGREVVIAITGEELESRSSGDSVVADVSKMLQVRYERMSRRPLPKSMPARRAAGATKSTAMAKGARHAAR
jgi:hypothetical protein